MCTRSDLHRLEEPSSPSISPTFYTPSCQSSAFQKQIGGILISEADSPFSYLILLSRQGKVVRPYSLVAHHGTRAVCANDTPSSQRLAKWFTTLSPKEKAKIIKDVSQLVLSRRTRMCNFLEYKGAQADKSSTGQYVLQAFAHVLTASFARQTQRLSTVDMPRSSSLPAAPPRTTS